MRYKVLLSRPVDSIQSFLKTLAERPTGQIIRCWIGGDGYRSKPVEQSRQSNDNLEENQVVGRNHNSNALALLDDELFTLTPFDEA